jgi:hypothetical protein
VKPGGLGSLQLQLFEACAEAETWEPTFIIDYPVEVSPLARASDSNPEITERFELFIVGREIANGFSELNDPEDQAARFQAQAQAKDAGDEEAMYYDADYIRALEYGLPPPAAAASASTAWSCCSPTAPPSATSSCSRRCARKPLTEEITRAARRPALPARAQPKHP